MKEKELKPCPFCGGYIEHKKIKNTLQSTYWFGCVKCGIETYIGLKKKDAIFAWNTRTFKPADEFGVQKWLNEKDCAEKQSESINMEFKTFEEV